MTIIVFSGPSLKSSDRARHPDVEFRPPARQGDLYLAAREAPRAIGLIDGYFDGVPAVLHKEILWAISQGIAVFGAASMGALRAAELADFGMTGIGRIFADFHEGRLQDDDEVALAHGPAETGYVALSEPMVNIRATLARAVATGMIAPAEAAALETRAKSCFYQDRTWARILAEDQSLPAETSSALRIWLKDNRLDQKREDALLLLEAIARHDASDPAPAKPHFTFERTAAWAHAPWQSRRATKDAGTEILDELRLEGAAYPALREQALLAHLALQAAAVRDLAPDARQIAATASAFRLPLGLYRQQEAELWAARNGLDPAGFQRLMQDRAGLAHLAQLMDRDLQGGMLDQLRLQNRYAGLAAKAQAKAALPDQAAAPVPLLLAWFFHQRQGRDIPEDVPAYAAANGFADIAHFLTALAREYAQSLKAARDAPARAPEDGTG